MERSHRDFLDIDDLRLSTAQIYKVNKPNTTNGVAAYMLARSTFVANAGGRGRRQGAAASAYPVPLHRKLSAETQLWLLRRNSQLNSIWSRWFGRTVSGE
ncbi:hypothetical protein EVAR_43641_1 [Eumeta japonica]|uniref:Uncharacterized protein n=1 Tax=Eumeta variegata TaxID=151549 RepID=A0A4C1ZML6_EUMVA|nr:hypothetical protein EVAR_43641_1 [Eumeta japonica]